MKIKDSGDRTAFASGAVRDMQKGKGRCDLMPLDIVAYMMKDGVLESLHQFQQTGNIDRLAAAIHATNVFPDRYTMYLEVAKHFEDGAEKYGERNWQKGLPVSCFINSGVRHYLKWLRGDKDEPHDRAFCWNILCAMWTCKHHPELNEYKVGR